jgi:hypothetical protein
MFAREPKKRTSADILEELQTAITSAIEELGARRDISMEAVHTNASAIMPGISMLLVESVGRQRARNDAKVQGTNADSMACGAGQNKPPARLSEVLNLNMTAAQRLANTILTSRKTS